MRDVIQRYAPRIEYLELDFSQHELRRLGLDSIASHPSAVWHLGIANGEKPIDILQHLTLPALQSLHICEMEDTTYSSLSLFLIRSSPQLRALSIRGDEDIFDWAECCSLIATTFENLEVHYPSADIQSAILRCHFGVKLENNPPFPRLQTLDARTRRPDFATLRSFHLVCAHEAFLNDAISACISADDHHRRDEITNHLASLAKNRGIDIHIAGEKNHVNFPNALI
ncbi:hypothetical protein B0H19DRAFT_1260970 [Mycena capillaripes]|nr:hypothetical protein B0H19DRAFT_1260970 [Mycena capillaripes]